MFIILDTFRKMSERNRYGSFENTSGLIANNAAVKGIGLTRILKKLCFLSSRLIRYARMWQVSNISEDASERFIQTPK